MFIIWGWGKKIVSDLGEVFIDECGNCHNKTSWKLYRVTTFITLFFIPIIPYSLKRFIMCTVCGSTKELDNDQFNSFKKIANLRKKFKNGEIDENELKNQLQNLNNSL